jgi:tetratricopeptide (TPR) repeat protein
VLQFYLGKLYYRLEMVDEAFDLLSTIEGPQDHLLDYHKIMANLYLRKQQFEEAITSLKKALSFKKRVVVPYICTQCQQESVEWTGRCRRCAKWNTLTALPWIETSQGTTNPNGATSSSSSVPYQGIASPFETV